MGRAPCCDKANVKKGPWSPEEDAKLKEYIEKHGTGGNWIALPQKAGLKRCGKSCRLRWLNYLRPNIKHGEFSDDEDRIICSLYASIGSRWSIIAAQLPGRTDNDIKNYWNTKLKKKLMIRMIHDPLFLRKPNQATRFSSHLHQASLLSSATSTPLPTSPQYNNYSSSCYTFARSFTEPVTSFSSSLLPSSNPVLQTQESFLSPPPVQHYQVKDSVLMFGGEASCSSSDGSCNNLQISHARELEYEFGGGASAPAEQMGFQSCFYNGVEESNQKLTVPNHYGDDVNWWSSGENTSPLDCYGLEEIKQLISSTTSSCNNFSFDENKTEDRVVYH